MNISDKQLREQLVKHIKGGEAFMPVDKLLDQMPFEKAGIIPDGLPYSFWQQLWHLRFAQYDILEFSRNPQYQDPEWPGEYWPKEPAPANRTEWNDTMSSYFLEREQFCSLIGDPGIQLLQPFPHGSGQTLLREALLVIEHTAYHTGEMLVIFRLLNA